jgi:hypothetical protein
VATVTLLATLAAARLQRRQMNSDDLKAGCKEVIFIFARGSTEPGNMVYCPDSLYTRDRI